MTDISEEMSDPIAEAIVDYWGDRCPDYSEGCPCCAVWAQYDALRSGNGGEVRAEYDPDAPPDHSADNAAHFILGALADALKVDFRPAEGSETWEGDVLGTMWHALTDSGVIDEWDGALRVQPKPQTEVKP